MQELIEAMIVESDNSVVPLLVKNLNPDFYEKVLLDLQVHIPVAAQGGINADFFSVVTYASILRGLYNSSYLQSEYSERILELMSKSTFKEGLVRGIPVGTVISHKFGEVSAVDAATGKTQKVELHDCGIIYRKDNPYIICISTEGDSFADLAKVLADISRIIWND